MRKHFYLFIFYTLLLTIFVQPLCFGAEIQTVNYDKVWTITFNKPIDKSTVNIHSIYIYDRAYKKLSTNISFGEKGNTIILSPVDNYLPDSTYSIFVSKSIKSINQKTIQDDYIYKFKTEKLSTGNLSTFHKTLDNLTVDIKYISDNQNISTKGLLIYNPVLNKPLVVSYYNKDTGADNVEISYKNQKLSGKIYSYDEPSNIIMYTFDDLDVTSIINMSSSSYEYEYIYNFENVINKNEVYSKNSFQPRMLINSVGNVIGIMHQESPTNKNKIFFKDINFHSNLSLPFSSIDSLYMNLEPPTISNIKYNIEKEIITLNLNNSEDYILYFSLDNKTYKPIYDSKGSKQIFTDSTLDIGLSTLNLDNLSDSTKLYFKVSSYKKHIESYLSEDINVLIKKLSEEDVAKNIVKNGTLTQFENKTIEQAFNNYFTSCTWTYINNSTSPEVKFQGKGIYKGSYHEITFLFSVNTHSQNFRIESVKVDNTPLNFSELPYLLQTIYN